MSHKVIGTDTDRFAAYDFLLTFHSNHGPVSYRFRDKRRFLLKIANFRHTRPRVFNAIADVVILGIGCRRWGSKTRMMGLLGRIRILTISSAVWIQCTNVTDRRRDGQTPGDSKDRLHIASRGKKCKCPLFRTSLSVVFSFF